MRLWMITLGVVDAVSVFPPLPVETRLFRSLLETVNLHEDKHSHHNSSAIMLNWRRRRCLFYDRHKFTSHSLLIERNLNYNFEASSRDCDETAEPWAERFTH